MTNKEIKKVRNIFKKLTMYTYVENFCEEPITLFEIWNVKLNFNDNLDINILFDFLDKGVCKFNFRFKGKLVDTNNKIGYKSNYFRLFNKVCKNSYKFEIVKNKKLSHNLSKLFDILEIDCVYIEEMILLIEILVNDYIIWKYIKYMWNYDITKYNQKIIDKRVQKYERKIELGLCTKNNLRYNLHKDRILNNTEKLYLLEKYYKKIVDK